METKLKPAVSSVRCSSTSQGASSSAAEGKDLPQQFQESEVNNLSLSLSRLFNIFLFFLFTSLPESAEQGILEEMEAEMSSKLAKLGVSAVLAYGLFDGVTYTTFIVLAFLGYEKSTGKNPAANLQALLGIVILMWAGNNVTRPFRVAGAAALAPIIDKGLRKIQKYFNFPSLVYAFALVVTMVATLCLTIVGLLILSRWGK